MVGRAASERAAASAEALVREELMAIGIAVGPAVVDDRCMGQRDVAAAATVLTRAAVSQASAVDIAEASMDERPSTDVVAAQALNQVSSLLCIWHTSFSAPRC